jgi:hypothetical protein
MSARSLFLLAGHSSHPVRMLECTLGYRDPASANWRIFPTPFEVGSRQLRQQ